MKLISVLLVDDNPNFLRIAQRFLQTQDDLMVVGVARGGRQAVVQAVGLRPQVILLDLAMPDLPGLEAIPLLRAELPELGIIVVTLLDGDAYREAALAAGADDFVPKMTMNTDLPPAIRRVVQTIGSRQGSAGEDTLEQDGQGP